MPTPSEQKALAFVAIVLLLGGAVRVLRAGPTAPPTPAEQLNLASQSAAAETAATHSRKGKGRKGGRLPRGARDTMPVDVAGVVSVPPTYARPGDPLARSQYGAGRNGFPPPSPRIDVDYRSGVRAAGATSGSSAGGTGGSGALGTPAAKVDLDVATEAEIDRLPRIGPATARRIVANRDSLGPFKSLEGLRRVKGMGPATLRGLAELVIFSGQRAPQH